jgi:hypothetical protein
MNEAQQRFRYHALFLAACGSLVLPFGANCALDLSVQIENTGHAEGDEVPQVYLAPEKIPARFSFRSSTWSPSTASTCWREKKSG